MEIQYINELTKNKDIHDIYNIGNESLPIYYNIYQLLELHKNPIYNIYKCVLDNLTIGFVIIEICSINKIHIMSIAISKKYRGNGYGSQIIEFLKKNLKIKQYLYMFKLKINARFNFITNIILSQKNYLKIIIMN